MESRYQGRLVLSDGDQLNATTSNVMPANSGVHAAQQTQFFQDFMRCPAWIPAFAGMTEGAKVGSIIFTNHLIIARTSAQRF